MPSVLETYGGTGTITGMLIPPEHLLITCLDCEPDQFPDLADPSRRARITDNIDELAMNIAKYGVREPVIVKKFPGWKRPVVVAGNRRVYAARIANQKLADTGRNDQPIMVPCVPERGDVFASMVLENEFRVDDTPMNRARKAQTMRDRGASDKDIAVFFGKSDSTIRLWSKALESIASVQKAVDDGKITIVVAAEIAKFPPAEQSAALKQAIEDGKGSAALENVRAAKNASKSGKPASSALRRPPIKTLKTVESQLAAIEAPDQDVQVAHAVMAYVTKGDPQALQNYPKVAEVFGQVVEGGQS